MQPNFMLENEGDVQGIGPPGSDSMEGENVRASSRVATYTQNKSR